jgi:hypothetical protein
MEGAMDMQRVKVYRLNEEGTWDDKGTGHISVEVMQVRPRRIFWRRNPAHHLQRRSALFSARLSGISCIFLD